MDNKSINQIVIGISTFCAFIFIIASLFLSVERTKIILILTSAVLMCITYIASFFSKSCFNEGIKTIFEGSCGYSLCFLANIGFCIYLVVEALSKKTIPRYYFELITTLFFLFFASILIQQFYDTNAFITAVQYSICSISWLISIIINTIINYYITDG